MKNRFIVIYSIFASLIFIFSLCFFGFNLYSEYSYNQKKSAKKFQDLVAAAGKVFSNEDQQAGQSPFSLKNITGDSADFSYIEIKEDNNSIFLYPAGTKKKETESKLTRPFQASLNINGFSYELVANIYLIKPSSVYYYARTSFLIVLIITVITIIMIIYIGMTESKPETGYEEENSDRLTEEDKSAGADGDSLYEDAENENSAADLNDEQSVVLPENDNTTIDAAGSGEVNISEQEQEADGGDAGTENAQQVSEENQNNDSPQETELPYSEVEPVEIDEKDNPPSGLFDPETGIGWELYLMTRLDNEIDRAIASEIDLSVFVIKLSGINRSDEKFKNVCNYLSIQFQFKDLIFEYKDDCIVCIKLSTDVDEALLFADKLYEDISNIIEKDKCNIGISSRSIRMVSGERIMLEATQALEHSLKGNDSPVIAFKVDSEKYRKFLEQN